MSLGLAPALTDCRPIERSIEAYKHGQSRLARQRLYPLTVFCTIYSLSVTLLMLSSRHPLLGIMFYLAGIPVWSLVEFLFHRYIYHGRFLDRRLDALHREQHHERPSEGWHLSGQLRDFLPPFFVAAPLSFLFPVYTLPVLLAGVVESYVGAAWTHYFLHFGKPRNRLFRFLKRRHLYHHGAGRKGLRDGTRDPRFLVPYALPKAGSQAAAQERR